MAARITARYVSRRLSRGGKILSQEEKAAENIYIKKTEQEKLQKLARKGPKAEESSTNSGGSTTDAKSSAVELASSTGFWRPFLLILQDAGVLFPRLPDYYDVAEVLFFSGLTTSIATSLWKKMS